MVQFSILGKLYIGPGMVLGYFIFRFKSWDNFRLFFLLPPTQTKTEPLDATGATASTTYICGYSQKAHSLENA